ncbi:conserved hypothetical protein [uncultured Pleomorphomonas sp.]|uniref:Uncharacterized protein n=1 Tax=uncultured Pleomorphomonas sp. TaxID=442121 RepID=A0A212L0Y5_9HYPH|nr:hypothetical protein [uncultured Pleomorphomonas sp.]SCM71234.1 conserved hypothetical protein [uncultured Pleomorphomonas sp.]
MKQLPCNADLIEVAERTVWYKTPPDAIRDSLNFVAHVLTYGTPEDVAALRRYLTLDEIRQALDQAPPGVFDGRSWSYWNTMVGRVRYAADARSQAA